MPAVDGVQWGEVAEWLAVLAAVGIAIASGWRAWKAARKAEEAQGRSTQALELAAAAQDRLAALAEAEAARYRVPWRIDRIGESKFLLVNTGDEAEHDVSIEANSWRRRCRRPLTRWS